MHEVEVNNYSVLEFLITVGSLTSLFKIQHSPANPEVLKWVRLRKLITMH